MREGAELRIEDVGYLVPWFDNKFVESRVYTLVRGLGNLKPGETLWKGEIAHGNPYLSRGVPRIIIDSDLESWMGGEAQIWNLDREVFSEMRDANLIERISLYAHYKGKIPDLFSPKEQDEIIIPMFSLGRF